MQEMKIPQVFADKHHIAIDFYHTAHRMYDLGEYGSCLSNARLCLESITKDIFNKAGFNTNTDLWGMIEQLKENDIFNREEASILHKLRQVGNTGAHTTSSQEESSFTLPTEEKAQDALELLDAALDILISKDEDSSAEHLAAKNASAVPFPLYYHKDRKYRAQWESCYAREQMMAESDYQKLYSNAKNGDISAMLDLAIGFVAPLYKFTFGNEHLICMPKRGNILISDAYDTRYYYWIIQACNRAVLDHKNGKTIPKRYLATALFEALKFTYIYRYDGTRNFVLHYSKNTDSYTYGDPQQLIRDVYNANLCDNTPVFDWAELLFSLIEEAGSIDAIDPNHENNRSINSIKYLLYCFCCLSNTPIPSDRFLIDGELHVRPGDIISPEQLDQCRPTHEVDYTDAYYSIALSNIYPQSDDNDVRDEDEGTAGQSMANHTENTDVNRPRKKGVIRSLLEYAAALVILAVLLQLCGGKTNHGPAIMEKVRQNPEINNALRFIDHHVFSIARTVLGDIAFDVLPHAPYTDEIEQLLKNAGAPGAIYSGNGTYALLCKDGGDYSNEELEWNNEMVPAIVWRNGSVLGATYASYIVLSDKWEDLLENDPEHVARLDVSSQFQSWVGLRGNSTITEVNVAFVPGAATENQIDCAHYNIHLRLQDVRTDEIFWVRCYLPDMEVSEALSMLPTGILTVCSIKDVSENEAASILFGKNISDAEQSYHREIALREDGSARGAEIAERVSSQYGLYFTASADSVICSNSVWWTSEIYFHDDAWLHILLWSGCTSDSPEYYLWAEDEGTWLEDEKFVGGTPCDESVQKLVGLENGLRVTSARARYFEADAADRLLDISWPQYVVNLHMEDTRTGRRYIALLCIPMENGTADISETIETLIAHEFGGVYDISDFATIEAAEYLEKQVG